MACLVLVGNWKNKKQKHNKWKDIVKKTKKKKKNKKKNKEKQVDRLVGLSILSVISLVKKNINYHRTVSEKRKTGPIATKINW